jgi:hypothetical protein
MLDIVTLFIAVLAIGVTIYLPYKRTRDEIALKKMHYAQLNWRFRRNYLHHTVRRLVELRAQIQFLQDKDRHHKLDPLQPDEKLLLEWERQREQAYGEAYAYMLTIPNAKVRGMAAQVLEQTTLEKKNEAITTAIIELGNQIHEELIEHEEKYSQN